MYFCLSWCDFQCTLFSRGALATLDEKDCGGDSDDDEGLQGSQPRRAITQGTTKLGTEESDSQVSLDVPEDVDDIIEDFDDDDN